MAKRHLTAKEIIKASEYFTQHLKPSTITPGYFEYDDNWSDSQIASVLSADIQSSAIANLRLKLHGKLEVRGSDIGTNIRVKELETLVTNLLSCYGELEVKYNKLIDTLAIGRVADVKHLKTTVKEVK